MRLNPSVQPITATDAEIRAAIEQAELIPLLAATAHLSGDRSMLRDELRPDPMLLLEPDCGFTPQQLELGRTLVTDALIAYRDAGCPPAPPTTDDELHAVFTFLIGDEATASYAPLLREELAPEDDGDLRAPAWTVEQVAPGASFRVAIVGAGMSGIVAAHRLLQAGVEVVLFEKNDDVGGTWFDNTYPGCRVDVPNHMYSYSFAQTGDWPQFFSTQQVLLDYFRSCADQFGVTDHVRFGTEVLGATFDEERRAWQVQTRTRDGEVEDHGFDALISAVGQLNRPNIPTIAGQERFAGRSFHSARWPDDLDVTDQRVAVIGTGASGVQFIPVVAEHAERTDVYLRTPPWLVPTPNYMDDLPDGVRWVLDHVPAFARWDRLWQFWRGHEGLLPYAEVDPDWTGGERSVSAGNDMVRELLTLHLQMVFPDPELYDKVLPQYPPIAKRVVRDNGVWSSTLARDDVDVITEPIAEITETGIRTADGVDHDVDVLIYGTGFHASEFLTPMRITGRGGTDLHARWQGDARAYLGITVPEFPNLFLLYGPNTNIVINGSIIFFSECETHYIVESVRMLLAGGHRTMECDADVHEAYNKRIDEGNSLMAWGASTVNSWYKNAKGRVAQNWPFSLLEYWQQTREPDPADYHLH